MTETEVENPMPGRIVRLKQIPGGSNIVVWPIVVSVLGFFILESVFVGLMIDKLMAAK